MRRILICAGVLGGGTAATFVAAALAATVFPTGNLVYQQQNAFFDRGFGGGIMVPVPAPGLAFPEKGVVVDDAPPDQPGG